MKSHSIEIVIHYIDPDGELQPFAKYHTYRDDKLHYQFAGCSGHAVQDYASPHSHADQMQDSEIPLLQIEDLQSWFRGGPSEKLKTCIALSEVDPAQIKGFTAATVEIVDHHIHSAVCYQFTPAGVMHFNWAHHNIPVEMIPAYTGYPDGGSLGEALMEEFCALPERGTEFPFEKEDDKEM